MQGRVCVWERGGAGAGEAFSFHVAFAFSQLSCLLFLSDVEYTLTDCLYLPSFLPSLSSFTCITSTFNEALRIGEQGYILTETDVLRARQKSTRITETQFNMGQLS
jgi:hypothetical protein